ncbi:MAG: hypothetical protein IJ111_07645 [Eggerthellaceae bacterium]|nr:hypothetical protein [Eggerthellaceae bacterium]
METTTEHDHGPDCTCGCHDHEHEHPHEHEHGHHHHSHEETLKLAFATVNLEAHEHEQSSTVSMTFDVNAGSTLPFQSVISLMQDIAEQVEQAGGIVGHIKAYAKDGDAFARASVTAANLDPTYEGDLDMQLAPGTEAQAVAIALLIDQHALLDICKAALERFHTCK